MNVFSQPDVANNYDAYYLTGSGKKIDKIEKAIVSKLIKHIPRSHMLELGCGTGHWSEYFIKQGFSLTGIDISEPMLKLAEQKNLNAEFLKADSHKIPFTNQSFSVISSITMLEFVEDRERVLQEIYRVLKIGGWLILGCLNAHSVLAQTKDQDETFKNADFLTPEKLLNKLQTFGKPKLSSGVYMSANFELLDHIPGNKQVQPVFMAAIVQKIK